MWIQQNSNPLASHVGDCVVRAISIAEQQPWELIYLKLCILGLIMADMPSSNQVWSSYLKSRGYRRDIIPNECPDCYTVKNFCKDNPSGVFILGTGQHVITVVDGNYVDDWDSGDEVPIVVWRKIK